MKSTENQRQSEILAILDFTDIVLKRCTLHAPYLSNQEFIRLLGISDQEAQKIRRKELIKYEWFENIIVYRLQDVRSYILSKFGAHV